MDTISILTIILSLAVTICAYIFIMPRAKDGKFGNAFLQFLHNLFHFKYLIIEKIIKFLYILTTAFVIFGGFFWLVAADYGNLYGLLAMIVGPIIVRIMYEFLLMIILQVQNVLEINRKIKWPEGAEKPEDQNYQNYQQ